MIRRPTIQAATALAGVALLSAPAASLAQTSGVGAGPGARARTTEERVNTEALTPPPVNSDYRRAAEGTLPLVPGQVVGGPAAAIDPAARPIVGVAPVGVAGAPAAALAPGMDVAFLIEHAVEMGIEGSTLAALAASQKPGDAGNDSVQALMKHAQDETAESKQLLARAAAAGSAVDANSPVRRFYGAANGYLSTLAQVTSPGALESPNNKAEIAMINHAVKAVLDGNHAAQLLPGGPLADHARMMRDEGMKSLDALGGTTPIDPSSPPTTAILAQRGRDLVMAAGALGPMVPQAVGFAPTPLTPGANGNLPNPGRLQDTRPLIPGGTFGTGDPTQQTVTGAEAAANVRRAAEGPNGTLENPIPTGAPGTGPSGYGVGNNNTPPTNSSAGSRPR